MFVDKTNENCEITVGKKTVIQENVVLGPRCKKITVGFGCHIGRDTYIDVDYLHIGDYTTIHHGSVLHGKKTSIGHNCWIGHYSIIDSLGGNTLIGNNVGVGAHSQLWSHMKFGDMLAGCRWGSDGELLLHDDVWLVGHSIVGPICAESKSMLLTGSVAVKDMIANHIYSGAPALDVTDKFGTQFVDKSLEELNVGFEKIKALFEDETGFDSKQFISTEHFNNSSEFTEFNLKQRVYKPRRTETEYAFMKFMLYDKAKFTPL